ncbi:MAG: glycine/sarcosine/betaine reductase selenoprotein B family protein [Dehalococcoidia bacterium]
MGSATACIVSSPRSLCSSSPSSSVISRDRSGSRHRPKRTEARGHAPDNKRDKKMPVDYLRTTIQQYPDDPPYRWSKYETSPWTSLRKPLRECTVAVISSGGIYLSGMPPFEPDKNDLTFRQIPLDADPASFRISHNHYQHDDAEQDPNVIFPVRQLQQLAREGIIAAPARLNFTFMGRIFKRSALLNWMAPALHVALKQEDVDAALFVPA